MASPLIFEDAGELFLRAAWRLLLARWRFIMMALLVVVSVAGTANADPAATNAARLLYLKGRYDEAAEQFATAGAKDANNRLGLARCKLAVGKRAEAERMLHESAQALPESAAVRAELAWLCFERGDWEAAQAQVNAALAIDKDCVAARFAQAELWRVTGKLTAAQQGYAWFISYFNRAPRVATAEDQLWLCRGIAEHARWTRNSGQFRRVVNELLPAALAREADFWPAHLESAQLFLEKFNEAEAAAEIAKGLAINPNAAELHAARGELALGRFELAAAKRSIDRALEINPELTWGHQLRADLLLADLRVDEAITALKTAGQLNPNDEQTLGRLLAAYIATDTPGKPSQRAEQLREQAAARNPHCGELFLAAGESFDRMRRYPLAAEYLRKAQERMPQLITVRGKLGLVLMRLGNEAEGAKLLAESFAIDPFNVRVKNMLEVLDVLKDYATIETDHFILKFDRGNDELLARYAARHLEGEIWPQLTQQLGYQPPGKTLIEIFSKSGNLSGHSWFSARMVGLPFIGTIGACAGQMIALTSPSELSDKYDWSLVLRHEMVHVLNLQQTHFAAPHWLTEGLAVHWERQPRPRKWTELLVKRDQEGELFNLDTLTLGFIRPQSSDDWTLAYCQAELYVEYLLATYGKEAINQLLGAYAEGCTTNEALTKCYSVKQADLEAGYSRFVKQAVADSRETLPRPKTSLVDLQRKAEAAPSDAAAAAELAVAWLDRNDNAQARRWALAAKRIEKQQPLAAYVLARLQLSIGDNDGAIALLEPALDEAKPQEDLLALLASLQLKAGDMAQAESLYRLGDGKFTASDRWLKGLARVYLQSGEVEKLVPILRRWTALEPDNLAIHKKLAQLSLEKNDFASAAAAATRAIHLDIQDVEAHALLAAALAGQDSLAAATDEYEVAIRLDGQQADYYAALARLQIRRGQRQDARLVIDRLRAIDPKHPKLAELEKGVSP